MLNQKTNSTISQYIFMKNLTYNIDIKAPAREVQEIMVAHDTYRKWTAAFNPTSTFEGSWEKGSKIYFIGEGPEGKKGGMIAEIAENKPGEFISIRHYGMIDGDKEITDGPEVEAWQNSFENYYFSEQDGHTHLRITVDSDEKYQDHFDEAWPKALAILKSLCE
jgi:uncharacterized protein YndB with AHSA1/START domain